MSSSKERTPSAKRVGLELIEFTEQHGILPWETPWLAGAAHHNPITGTVYTGSNPLRLHCEAFARELDDPRWVTYRQAQQHGGQVRKGTRGVFLLRAGSGVKRDDATGEIVGSFRYVKGFTVHNVSDVDGLDLPPLTRIDVSTDDANARADDVVDAMPKAPRVTYAPGRAFYSPRRDLVSIPARDQFTDQRQFDLVRFHELAHATGHETRLDRPGVTDAHEFGSHDYSLEELVAEIAAQTLVRHVGHADATTQQSAAYVNSWLTKLKAKPELIVTAASDAQRAVDYIVGVERQYDNNATSESTSREAATQC